MELKILTEKTLSLFGVDAPDHLGKKLREACDDHDKLRAFKELVDGDLTIDWMQKIYQYYLADRKEKKQDYTPKSIAELMGRLAGNSDQVIDMCAGSGALLIQKWILDPTSYYFAYEFDDGVIDFLKFNMVIRNIAGTICHADVLTDDIIEKWEIVKGDEFGKIVNIKSAV